jgi:hypothetical protein
MLPWVILILNFLALVPTMALTVDKLKDRLLQREVIMWDQPTNLATNSLIAKANY